MKLEIIKEFHRDDNGELRAKYVVRKKLLGFISLYRLDMGDPTLNRVFCLLANGLSLIVGTIFAFKYFFHAEYINIFYIIGTQITLLFYANYAFRELHDTLDEAERYVKKKLKLLSANKKNILLHQYTLKNNELIIEKQNDSEQ